MTIVRCPIVQLLIIVVLVIILRVPSNNSYRIPLLEFQLLVRRSRVNFLSFNFRNYGRFFFFLMFQLMLTLTLSQTLKQKSKFSVGRRPAYFNF